MEKTKDLDIIIQPEKSRNSKFYTISCVQFPNVVTQGKTIEEAKKNLKEAVSLYLECSPEEIKKLSSQKNNNEEPMISRISL